MVKTVNTLYRQLWPESRQDTEAPEIAKLQPQPHLAAEPKYDSLHSSKARRWKRTGKTKSSALIVGYYIALSRARDSRVVHVRLNFKACHPLYETASTLLANGVNLALVEGKIPSKPNE